VTILDENKTQIGNLVLLPLYRLICSDSGYEPYKNDVIITINVPLILKVREVIFCADKTYDWLICYARDI
jgi:hypothetical protein